MDKADSFALKTLAREQEFAKAIQIFYYKRGTEEIIIPAVSFPPWGFLSPDNVSVPR